MNKVRAFERKSLGQENQTDTKLYGNLPIYALDADNDEFEILIAAMEKLVENGKITYL